MDWLKIKGIIGATVGALAVASYIVYYIAFYNGVKLNELYFIPTGGGIAVFTGLLFTFFKK